MTVRDVMEILGAECLVGEEGLDAPVESGCGSDLMSDVLAFVKDNAVLITGLINPQVIRTAEMLDIKSIAFSRGKRPSDEILEMAKEIGIVILSTRMTTYTACGELYLRGLPGTNEKRSAEGGV